MESWIFRKSQSLSRSALAEFYSGIAVSSKIHSKSPSLKGGDTITGITVNRETCLREDQGLEKRVACVKSNYLPIWLFSVGANHSNTCLSVSYKNYNIASLGLNSKTLGFILALGISFVNYI